MHASFKATFCLLPISPKHSAVIIKVVGIPRKSFSGVHKRHSPIFQPHSQAQPSFPSLLVWKSGRGLETRLHFLGKHGPYFTYAALPLQEEASLKSPQCPQAQKLLPSRLSHLKYDFIFCPSVLSNSPRKQELVSAVVAFTLFVKVSPQVVHLSITPHKAHKQLQFWWEAGTQLL